MSEFFNKWVLRNLTDEQLDELCREIYDRWCWETGDPEERAIYEMADDERTRRKLPPVVSTLTFTAGAGVVMTSEADGSVTITLDEEKVTEMSKRGETVLDGVLDGLKNGKL